MLKTCGYAGWFAGEQHEPVQAPEPVWWKVHSLSLFQGQLDNVTPS